MENNYTDKQVALFKEDKEQYSLLIHKTDRQSIQFTKGHKLLRLTKRASIVNLQFQRMTFSKKRVPLLLINFMKMHLST